jgi:hypothetical protein
VAEVLVAVKASLRRSKPNPGEACANCDTAPD